MTEISGKVAVVTGGGNGIGMGLAKELAKQGAAVAVADILFDNARKVADEIGAAGGKAVAIEVDISDRGSIGRMKAQVHAALGRVQLVFANAGVNSFDPLLEMTDDDVDWVVMVNLMGTINTVRAFLPDMVETGGHVVATASMAGLLPGWIPVHVPYSASKMGVIGFMMNLSLEMAQHEVFTTIYCPGGVASGMKANNARYRPDRFGGPGEGAIEIPEASFKKIDLAFYTPEGVAPIVMEAVRENRPFVFDHPEQRRNFRETYANVIEACYDSADSWYARNGEPEASANGAVLADG